MYSIKISGGDSEKDPPVPMPNTEVKLLCVDNTWRETAREDRKLPERKAIALQWLFFVGKRSFKGQTKCVLRNYGVILAICRRQQSLAKEPFIYTAQIFSARTKIIMQKSGRHTLPLLYKKGGDEKNFRPQVL